MLKLSFHLCSMDPRAGQPQPRVIIPDAPEGLGFGGWLFSFSPSMLDNLRAMKASARDGLLRRTHTVVIAC